MDFSHLPASGLIQLYESLQTLYINHPGKTFYLGDASGRLDQASSIYIQDTRIGMFLGQLKEEVYDEIARRFPPAIPKKEEP